MSTLPKVDLPSRTLFTSLFDSISAIKPGASLPQPTGPPLQNPLRGLPPLSRNLFLTAHCLLPTTFLAALDILEKRLVVRYTTPELAAEAPIPGSSPPGLAEAVQAEEAEPAAVNSEFDHSKSRRNPPTQVYYVRSSPPAPQNLTIPGPNFASTARDNNKSSSSSKSYVYEVRPRAWNCTCIAFTLAAYQRNTLPHRQDAADFENGEGEDIDRFENTAMKKGLEVEDGGKFPDELRDLGLIQDIEMGGEDEENHQNLWYGGIDLNNQQKEGRANAKNSTIPVCKHLLAAVLVERCPGLFGAYLVEETATLEAIAEKAVLWG